MEKTPNNRLYQTYLINGNHVVKQPSFLGFDVYQYDSSDRGDEYAGEIITYFVKGDVVKGTSTIIHSGGAECSTSATVTFTNSKSGK